MKCKMIKKAQNIWCMIGLAIGILVLSSCKVEEVKLIESSSVESETTMGEMVEETIVNSEVIMEDLNDSGKKSLEAANIKEEVIQISDIEEGYVYQEIKYPKLTADGDEKIGKALDYLNNELREGAENFKNEHKSEVRENKKESSFDEYRYDYDNTDVYVTQKDEKYLSFRVFTYENLMGAHPSYVIDGYVFDANTGDRLGLYDLVKDKEELRAYLYKWCDENNKDNTFFDGYKDVIDDYVDENYFLQFYIENDMVNVIFQTYDIAPYAEGAIHVELPKEILK